MIYLSLSFSLSLRVLTFACCLCSQIEHLNDTVERSCMSIERLIRMEARERNGDDRGSMRGSIASEGSLVDDLQSEDWSEAGNERAIARIPPQHGEGGSAAAVEPAAQHSDSRVAVAETTTGHALGVDDLPQSP